MMETAIAIGHMPIAACELIRYRADTLEPKIPPEVVDLGLRGAPNFELLQLTRPDLILNSPYYTMYQHRLEALAPVVNLPFFTPGEAPLPKAIAALTDLARAIDDLPAGQAAADRTGTRLDALAGRLSAFDDRPVCLVNIGDARHLRAFGFDSLFGSTLERVGLTNAWSEGTKFSFLAPVPIERLATMPEARLVIIGNLPPEARRGLRRSVLWQALPAVIHDRIFQLPSINAFGGVPSALHFAELLARAFETGPVATI